MCCVLCGVVVVFDVVVSCVLYDVCVVCCLVCVLCVCCVGGVGSVVGVGSDCCVD